MAGTLLRLSGADAALPRASTRDLLAADPAAEVYAETDYPAAAGWHPLRVLAGASHKLIRSSELEYYDLADDPSESTDLGATRTAAARAAVGRLAGYVETASRAAPPSSEAQARLRALGYVSGPSASPRDDSAVNPARVIDAWTRFERSAPVAASRQGLAALATLVREHPDGYVFAAAYARALQDTGRHGEAVRVLRGAVDRFPAEPTLFHDLAVAARAAGDAAEAMRAEQAALALDDANAAAHHGLGLLLVEAGRPGEALGAFTRAVELDASNAAYWADLGNAHRDDGDIRAADAAYGRALQIDGAQADAANGRGVLLVRAGRPADAVGWFERALAADPSLHEARLNLGIAYQHSGQYDLAQRTYREVLRTAPRSAARERQAAADLLASLR
ncbi:MAG: tetratricopeptide repeat protein [Vicinamibacterales bacterium]